MTDITKTLRHTFTVQVEIDPVTWGINCGIGPADIQDDSVGALELLIRSTVDDWIKSTGNKGKVRMVAHERSAPGAPRAEAS